MEKSLLLGPLRPRRAELNGGRVIRSKRGCLLLIPPQRKCQKPGAFHVCCLPNVSMHQSAFCSNISAYRDTPHGADFEIVGIRRQGLASGVTQVVFWKSSSARPALIQARSRIMVSALSRSPYVALLLTRRLMTRRMGPILKREPVSIVGVVPV